MGIDTIGNYLTEINVTSPTGIQEINQLNNIKIEELSSDKIEKKLKKIIKLIVIETLFLNKKYNPRLFLLNNHIYR